MTAIRRTGKINADTTLIDFNLNGATGIGAVYLIESEEKLLIDCGTRTEAPGIVKILRGLKSFPPDKIVFTHSHDDHCQGIHIIRREARREHKDISVLASHAAVPLLEDQSWQKAKDIRDVSPISEGDAIDIGGLVLRVIEVPGHSDDSIALLDERNENLFVGDSLGYKFGDKAFVPPFIPPWWDTDAFCRSMEKIKRITYRGIGLAHFGYIFGKEAEDMPDEAISVFQKWWRVYEQAEEHGKLDDYDYICSIIKDEVGFSIPDVRVLRPSLRFLLKVMKIGRILSGKKPYPIDELILREFFVRWLAKGYKTYRKLGTR